MAAGASAVCSRVCLQSLGRHQSPSIAVPNCYVHGTGASLSAGGYATLAGLTFTPDLYCCGVDVVGPSNILTLFKVSLVLIVVPPLDSYAAIHTGIARQLHMLGSASSVPLTKKELFKLPTLPHAHDRHVADICGGLCRVSHPTGLP